MELGFSFRAVGWIRYFFLCLVFVLRLFRLWEFCFLVEEGYVV